MPYRIESNEEVKTEQNRTKKLSKIETESDDGDFIAEIIPDEFQIDNFDDKKINEEENKSNFEDQEISILELNKIKEIYSNSKILNLEMTSYNSNNINNNNLNYIITNEEQNNNKEKKKIYIQINPLGYSDSKRKKDGITFFGYEKEKNGSEEIEIDIKINPIDYELIDDKYYGKHFQIKFNPYDKQYYLKDLGHGFGTFIKIIDWIEIKNNFLLNIGENYLILSFEDDEDDEYDNNIINKNNFYENKLENFITIKIFSLSTQIKNYKFYPSDCPITIGRTNENSIFIDDNMLSRIHCTIDYGNEKWYIQDGFARNGLREEEIKKSTNGCWIFAYEEKEIVNRMIFKANHNLFICNLV